MYIMYSRKFKSTKRRKKNLKTKNIQYTRK